MNRIQFVANSKIIKTTLSSFLPRPTDFIVLLGKTYITEKVTIHILNELAVIELMEVENELEDKN
jgi:hypothetical protein